MEKDSVVPLRQPGEFEDLLTDVLRQGAFKLLAQAVEAEVADFLATHADLTTEDGRQRLVRHGRLPERTIQTGIGSVEVQQPRVRDRGSDGEKIRFSPAILPPYARRSKSLVEKQCILVLIGATRHQRCWVHKAMNVLDKLPKSVQPGAKADLREIWMAEARDDAEKALDRFLAKYQVKYDKAAECLAKGRDTLLAFYDFPAEHWKHIRTGNPIESTFATVRHRTRRSKECLSYETAKIMVFKMIQAAQKSWRKLDGQNQLPKVIEGIKFNDGIKACPDHAAA